MNLVQVEPMMIDIQDYVGYVLFIIFLIQIPLVLDLLRFPPHENG
jgi:hypothetical protein